MNDDNANQSTSAFQDWRENQKTRWVAERRRAQAQRQFNQLEDATHSDLRRLRRHGKTKAIVVRSRLAEIGVHGLIDLAAKLRTPRKHQ